MGCSDSYSRSSNSTMRFWPGSRSDGDEVSLLRLLPKEDDVSEFLRFIYPLRARAVAFMTTIQIVYYIADSIVMAYVNQQFVTETFITRRVLMLTLSVSLLLCAFRGNPQVLSKAVHIWYALLAFSRYWTLIRYIVSTPTTVYIVAALATVMMMISAIGCTMHVDFALILGLSVPELVLLMTALSRATDDSDSSLNKVKLAGYITLVYLLGYWTVHTVQYNTVMMYLWNKRYRQEKAERDMQQKAQALHRSHLAATLHDIGSPLQAFVNGIDEVKNWVCQLPSKLGCDAVLETLSEMETSVALMSLARRRAVAYAKPFTDVDELQPNLNLVNIRRLTQDCVRVIIAFGKTRQSAIPINFSIADDVPATIRTDGDWVVEALTNFLSNAVKFTETGFIHVHICLRSKGTALAPVSTRTQSTATDINSRSHVQDETFLRFEVRDTGIGLSEEAISNLFDTFRQLPPDSIGTGLGLWSVKRKVELLSGAVGAEQNSPRGALFWFEIPLVSEKMSELEDFELQIYTLPTACKPLSAVSPRSEPRTLTSPEQLLHKHGIDPSKISLLIVEDQKMLLKFSKNKFANLGFMVDTAADGVQALERMKSKRYDVVLMDQNMPRLDGLDAVRLLREWQRETPATSSNNISEVEGLDSQAEDAHDDALVQCFSDIPNDMAYARHQIDPLIFMMSASILDTDREQARDLDIADYFEKPLHVSHVVTMILSHVISKSKLLPHINPRSQR